MPKGIQPTGVRCSQPRIRVRFLDLQAGGSAVFYQMFARAQHKCVFALYIRTKTVLLNETRDRTPQQRPPVHHFQVKSRLHQVILQRLSNVNTSLA